MPMAKVKTRSRAGVMSPAKVRAASSVPVITMCTCTSRSSHRRSNESASTPAGRASSIMGVMVAACRRPQGRGVGEVDEKPLGADGLHPAAHGGSEHREPEHRKARAWKGAHSE
jgi:hypothetical protein